MAGGVGRGVAATTWIGRGIGTDRGDAWAGAGAGLAADDGATSESLRGSTCWGIGVAGAATTFVLFSDRRTVVDDRRTGSAAGSSTSFRVTDLAEITGSAAAVTASGVGVLFEFQERRTFEGVGATVSSAAVTWTALGEFPSTFAVGPVIASRLAERTTRRFMVGVSSLWLLCLRTGVGEMIQGGRPIDQVDQVGKTNSPSSCEGRSFTFQNLFRRANFAFLIHTLRAESSAQSRCFANSSQHVADGETSLRLSVAAAKSGQEIERQLAAVLLEPVRFRPVRVKNVIFCQL